MTDLVFLTGAGISAESGLATFRGEGGLWEEDEDLRALCSAEGLAAQPSNVHAFYDARRAQLREVAPNPAHVALAQLQERWIREARGTFTLATMNSDDLHERAGSRDVHHLHGTLFAALCAECGNRLGWEGELPVREDCPACDAPALRPDVVLFGETPRHRHALEALATKADIFIAIGTSASVHPAARLIGLARANGAVTIEVNPAPTGTADILHVLCGPASEEVPRLVRDLLAGAHAVPF